MLLAKELSLQTECGYVELVKLEDSWLVFDVIFGVPLFADKVAKQVLHNMTAYDVLNAQNVEKVEEKKTFKLSDPEILAAQKARS